MTAPAIDTLELAHGKHRNRDDGVCLLEAVAWYAGEEHTDHPKCVSPYLGELGRALNDRLAPEDRQRLKAYIFDMAMFELFKRVIKPTA